jgi:hypothetical protein
VATVLFVGNEMDATDGERVSGNKPRPGNLDFLVALFQAQSMLRRRHVETMAPL